MSELVDFLNKRIDDEERALAGGMWDTGNEGSFAEHATLEIASKRRVIEIHAMTAIREDGRTGGYWWDAYCQNCTMHGEYADITKTPEELPCDTLKALAMVYVDDPDYRDEWRL